MNASEPFIKMNTALGMNESELRRMFGYSESYFAYDTCQFNYYDLYAASLFNAKHKYEQREKQFPIDLENCRQLGACLVEKAKDARAGTLVRERLRLPEAFLKGMYIIFL